MALFVTGFLLSLSLSLDLGTVNVAMIRVGIRHGPRPAFFLGLGSCLGDLAYAGASLVAISFILQSLVVRWALWLLGTLVLLVLAYRMLRESLHEHQLPGVAAPAGAPASSMRQLAQGFGLAISSPSAILWFATVGGSIIAASAGAQSALLPFFSGFFISGVLWSLAIALLSGQGRRVLGPRLVRWFSIGSAALFLYLALKVFFDGYNTLLQG